MNAPRLDAVQRLFQAEVQAGGLPAQRLQELVVADGRGSAAERLGVYVDAYRLRLIEALGIDYPTLQAVLGAPEFERLCRAYIDTYPSTTPSVRWFGRNLPGFLAATPAYATRPVLSELASFEWTQGETFDAPDAAKLSIADIAAVPPAAWAGMRLLPHPSVRRLDLRCNVPAIFRAQAAGKKRPAPKRTAAALPWLLWRDEVLDIRWRSLKADEAQAFDAICANRSFAEVCELLCGHVDAAQAPLHAAGLLKRWITDGLISDLEFERSNSE